MEKLNLPSICIFCLIVCSSCEDFVSIDPPSNQIITATVYTDNASAISAINGIYSEMSRSDISGGGIFGTTALTSLSADELQPAAAPSPITTAFYSNSLNALEGHGQYLWNTGYKHIYQVNALLEGLASSTEITTDTKNQLIGEAKFLRAFCHFYLTNLFGDIPLLTTTDYRVTSIASRTPQSEVYQQILDDLLDAQEKMESGFEQFGDERVRPNKEAATALLARVYLYMEEWEDAEIQATAIIENTSTYSLLSDLNDIFLGNSEEAIWQLSPELLSVSVGDGGFNYDLADPLLNDFEPGDDRFNEWIWDDGDGTYTAFKYKAGISGASLTEYYMVFRLAEQYLIRAEARAQQGGDLSGAIADLDAIRGRANLPLIADTNPGINQADLLLVIEQERRIELFVEGGHRWLDLKRTGRADAVLSPVKGADWESTDVLYPIAQSEIDVNPNLLPQNDGY